MAYALCALTFTLLTLSSFTLSSALAQPAESETKTVSKGRVVHVIVLDGPIGVASGDYVARALQEAQDAKAELAIIKMDTPGGLVSSMRVIIREILDSDIPVASFVAPSGSRAASAGTYIMYASHIAAMAPGTNLGAATPVQIGGQTGGMTSLGSVQIQDLKDVLEKMTEGDKEKEDNGDDEEDKTSSNEEALAKKAVNDAAAYIRSLAEMRGRNVEWAEEAVREGVSLTNSEALEKNVIDLIAMDVPDLLQKLDGREVKLDGGSVTLDTAGAVIIEITPDWSTQILSIITDPNVAFLLMMLGIYGIMFELYNPGGIVPGVVGAIALFLGLYALNVLPINYAGLALLLLGITFMVAEAFVPSFGVLGIGGLIAFVIGGLILFDMDMPGFEFSLALLITMAAITASFILLVVVVAGGSFRAPVVTGVEGLLRKKVSVTDWSGGEGHVQLEGESWRAVSNATFAPGATARIQKIEGNTLFVEPDAP